MFYLPNSTCTGCLLSQQLVPWPQLLNDRGQADGLMLAATFQMGGVFAGPGAQHALQPPRTALESLCPGAGAVLFSPGRSPEGRPLALPLLVVL